jgi:pleiotropic regulator 1
VKLTSKIHDEYDDLRTLPEALIKQQKDALKARIKAKNTVVEEVDESEEKTAVSQLIDAIPDKS